MCGCRARAPARRRSPPRRNGMPPGAAPRKRTTACGAQSEGVEGPCAGTGGVKMSAAVFAFADRSRFAPAHSPAPDAHIGVDEHVDLVVGQRQPSRMEL